MSKITHNFLRRPLNTMSDDILQIEGYCYFTRPFPSSPGPLYQNEIKCSAFDMQMILHSHANNTHFHKKGCAPRASYWKWGILELGNGLLSIKPRFFFQHSIVNVKWTAADFFEETRAFAYEFWTSRSQCFTLHQAPVVQTLDSAIQRINNGETNCTIQQIA